MKKMSIENITSFYEENISSIARRVTEATKKELDEHPDYAYVLVLSEIVAEEIDKAAPNRLWQAYCLAKYHLENADVETTYDWDNVWDMVYNDVYAESEDMLESMGIVHD